MWSWNPLLFLTTRFNPPTSNGSPVPSCWARSMESGGRSWWLQRGTSGRASHSHFHRENDSNPMGNWRFHQIFRTFQTHPDFTSRFHIWPCDGFYRWGNPTMDGSEWKFPKWMMTRGSPISGNGDDSPDPEHPVRSQVRPLSFTQNRCGIHIMRQMLCTILSC